MRSVMAVNMADFSVRNSEKLKLMSIVTIFISAIIIIGSALRASGDGFYSSQIPIYFVAFNLIFLTSLLSEYFGAWLNEGKPVHICRSVCSLMAMGLALIELFVFYNFGSGSFGAPEQPFSISSVVAQFLS